MKQHAVIDIGGTKTAFGLINQNQLVFSKIVPTIRGLTEFPIFFNEIIQQITQHANSLTIHPTSVL